MGKGGRCVRLTTLPLSCAVVTKSGNLNFLEPSGPLQACNGTAFIEYWSVVPDTLLDLLLNLNTRYIQSITALRPHAAQHTCSTLLSISA